MIERGELFRGAIEDRYAGVFADGHPYPIGAGTSRADRIAAAIEVLRVAALSSYENRAISSGVLILGPDGDTRAADRLPQPDAARVLAVADRREELLPARRRPAHAVSGHPRRPPARHRRRAAVVVGALRRRHAAGAGAVHLRGARAGDGARRPRLRGAEPVARDQGVRRGRRGPHVPPRALAPAGRAGQVRAVGRGGRAAVAGDAPVPDGARALQRAAGRAVRRAARPGARRCRTGVGGRPRGHRARPPKGAGRWRDADAARPAGPAHRPRHHRSRAQRAGRAGQPGRRDGHRRERRADRRRRDPALGDRRSAPTT